MKPLLFCFFCLWVLGFVVANVSQMEFMPGDLTADPNFVEVYYPQKQYVQLSGVCSQVLRVSLPSIFAAKLNDSTLTSMKAHFRGLYLASRGSAKAFVEKLMTSFVDDGGAAAITPVLSFDGKRKQFVCTHPVMASCRIASAVPYNDSLSLDSNSDWFGMTEFTARFLVGSSDASIFMCTSVTGRRKPLTLFINTLPTLNELTASLDEITKKVTVRCSGVMSSIFSRIYLWELLIVSPGGSSILLDEWTTMAYANDKPEPGLLSATLTAELPISRISVAAITFHCQIVNILGRKFTERLLPFVLEPLMQPPSNIIVEEKKLFPIDVLGSLPNLNIPRPSMVPLSTFYRLRCTFDSVAPQLVRIVWDSYFFNPKKARYMGKRHSLDNQFILLNETLYTRGHHLCRVWLKDADPSTSLCSDPKPLPLRPLPLCKNISVNTNLTSLLTDLIAFVPLGEGAKAEPSRDLVVQSMTTALIVLSCVSGIFFLCLIMMIGRFHCRLRPLVRSDGKHGKNNFPLLALSNEGNETSGSASKGRQPSISRRNSFPRDGRSETSENQGPSVVPGINTNAGESSGIARSESRQNGGDTARSGRQPSALYAPVTERKTSSVACEADLDRDDDEWNNSLNVSQVPLLATPRNGNATLNDSATGNLPIFTSTPPVPPLILAPTETPAPSVPKSSTQSSLSKRCASSSAVDSNEGNTKPTSSEKSANNDNQSSMAKSLGNIGV